MIIVNPIWNVCGIFLTKGYVIIIECLFRDKSYNCIRDLYIYNNQIFIGKIY